MSDVSYDAPVSPLVLPVDVWPGDTWRRFFTVESRTNGARLDLSDWTFEAKLGDASGTVTGDLTRGELIVAFDPTATAAAIGKSFALVGTHSSGDVRTFVAGTARKGGGAARKLGPTNRVNADVAVTLFGGAKGDTGTVTPELVQARNDAMGAATASGQAASAASDSASQAASSAGSAALSASNAAASAASVAGSAATAQGSANAAAGSATVAGARAADAATSAQAASGSASQASTSATAAAGSATSAQTQATAAAGSATAAGNSATAAAGSASSALTQANAAAGSATQAQRIVESGAFLYGAPSNIAGNVSLATITQNAILHYTLTGNVVFTAMPANPVIGMIVTLELKQDATGNRTVQLNNVAGSFGVPITLSTAPNALDEVHLIWDGVRWKFRIAGQGDAIPTAWVV